MEAGYWLEQAATFRKRAEETGDPMLALEFAELADVCEQVAAEIEDRAVAG